MFKDSPSERLKNALEELYRRTDYVEKAFEDFEAQDLNKENENLRENIKEITVKFEKARTDLENMTIEYDQLEKNFREELNQKWITNLNFKEENMQRYFKMRLETETERLNVLKIQLRQRADSLTADFKVLEKSEKEELSAEINALKIKIDNKIAEAQLKRDSEWTKLLENKTQAIENMRDINIESDALKAVRKFFNWETFFGLKLISSLGILLIIIGVFTFGRYVYLQMNSQMQCASIFALGLLFLISGEILNKKWHGVFSLAITAGGSAILFLGTALGYLALDVLSMEAALGICAGVSVLSFVLAVRRNSQIIAVFALIGGYMPILALESGSEIIIWSAVYFAILNIFSLALSTRRNWRAVRFIGLLAGLFADLAIIFMSRNNRHALIIASLVLAYVSYLIIPVFGTFFTKSKLKTSDIVLLTCNIFFRFMIGLLAVYSFGLEKYQAVVPAFFMLTCIVMALLCERGAHKIIPEKEKGSMNALFFVTSIAFASLIILFWFDKIWFSSGWLVESMGLLIYGLLKERKRFSVAGIIIGGLCLSGFLTVNVPDYQNSLFVWQYLLVTMGLTLTFILVGIKKITKKYWYADIFQFAGALNLWIFIIYLFNNPVLEFLRGITSEPNAASICAFVVIIAGILYSYILPRIRAVYSKGTHIAAICTGISSTALLLSANRLPLFDGDAESGVGFIKILIVVLFVFTNLIGVFWTRDFLQLLILKKTLPLSFYPLLLSGYFIFLVSQNLLVQMHLEPSSIILTAVFGITALCWIIFGFIKRNNVIRVSGLALSFFSVIKLFLLDLSILATELKIVSYFTMGILLLAISFIYQYFNKKIKD